MRTVCSHDASTESVASRVNVASRMRTRDRVVVARLDFKCVCSKLPNHERRAGYTVLYTYCTRVFLGPCCLIFAYTVQ